MGSEVLAAGLLIGHAVSENRAGFEHDAQDVRLASVTHLNSKREATVTLLHPVNKP